MGKNKIVVARSNAGKVLRRSRWEDNTYRKQEIQLNDISWESLINKKSLQRYAGLIDMKNYYMNWYTKL